MKICPKCGSINGDGSNNCTKCGTALGSSQHRSANQNMNQGRNNTPPIQHSRPISPQQHNVGQPAGQRTNYGGTYLQQPVVRPQQPPIPPRTPQNRYQKKSSSINSKILIALVCFLGVILLSGIAIFSLGNSKMTESEIDKAYGDGVVLIMNSGYYEVVLSNGKSVYFSSYSPKDGLENLTDDPDSIVTSTSFGTGFFVSNDGKIATNNHVVAADVTEKEVSRQMKSIFSQIKSALSEKYNQYKQYDEQLLSTIRQKYLYDQDCSQEIALSDALEEEMEKLKELYNYINDINPSDSELKYHSSVSIAYNNTYITHTSDFVPCVVKDLDPDHDLAIIQLKDKKTPSGKYVFDIPSEDKLTSYSLPESFAKSMGRDKNEKLVMIGFNQGAQLAFTKEGIRAQCTSGSISQDDTDKIMYTIPSLHGSSGSPVLNQKGQLVAVNFAGIDVTQSFNYGVKARHLYSLMNK